MSGGVTTNQAYTAAGVLCDVETGAAASCSGGNVGADDAGRLASYGGYTFRYDAQGRLTSACDDADCVGSGFRRIDFRYDGEGHRTAIVETPAAGSAVTTTFRYAGDAIVAEYRDGTLYREYLTDEAGTISKVTVPAGQTGAGTYLVTWNGHGDALALWRIESSGSLTLANSYTYSTWGLPSTATHNGIADLGFRFTYVGAADVQWDGTYGLPLLYMHARHYSPTLGRFLQPDPSRLDAQLFVYAGNGPVSRVDPSGTLYVLKTYYLKRSAVRYAANRMYVEGRFSYNTYRHVYWSRALYIYQRRTGYAVRFNVVDACPGVVVAGAFGIWGMGMIDLGLGAATMVGAPTGLAELILVPMDIGAIWLTFKMIDLVQQGATKPCTDIRFP